MNTNVLKKSLSMIVIFSMIMTATFGLCDTKIEASATADVNSNLNTQTKTFVNRLNQIPQNFIFNQSLKKGSSISPDVQYLKWVLNSDARTSLADNPNMMMDELTSTFGPLTQDAVKKFQTVYRSEILDPLGITVATGVVGKGTRQKLNSLLTKARLIANYSSVLNTALTQRLASSSYTINYNDNSTSSDVVDFSYLNPLNLDTIFSSYTATDMATSTEQYNEASVLVASSSDASLSQTATSTGTGTSNTNGDSGTGNTGGGSNTDPNSILSKSPAPGVLAPYTVIGVTALVSGDFVGAAAASYLSGKGSGVGGIKNLVSDYTNTLSMGQVGSSATVSQSGNSGGSNGGSSGGLLLVGGALVAGSLMGGGASSAGNGAAGAAGGSAASGASSQTVLSQFGGKITMTKTCECSANYMITLYDLSTKMPLSIMFQPGVSSLKMNYNPTMGQTVLGGYLRGAATCMIYVGTSCSTFGNPAGTIDTIRGIGTTLSPASI